MAIRLIVNGGFQDLSGAPLALGTLTFRLVQDIVNSNVQIGAGIVTSVLLDSNGNVNFLSLWPATYIVKAYSAGGQLVWQSTVVVPEGTDPFSLTPGVTTNALLQENGSFFLTEDGSGIILLEA
jgi:hypothetical protein